MSAPETKLDTRFSDADAVATSWDDTRRVLEAAELFWITTVRRDGRPHTTPLVAVWLDDAIYFCTGPSEQKAVNLTRNRRRTPAGSGVDVWRGTVPPVRTAQEGDVSTEENKALVRRFYSEMDNLNPAVIDELVAEDFVNHSPPPFPVEPGREGLKQAFELFRRATPGSHEILDQVAEGDKVVTRLRAVGTHEDDLPGIPRTGNPMEVTATVVHRIEDGKIVEKWSDRDELALLQQLGVVSLPEGPS